MSKEINSPVVDDQRRRAEHSCSQIPVTSAGSSEGSSATGTDYAPFPERELLDYALATPVRELRKTLRDAVQCHAALRERCLIAEMKLGQLSGDAQRMGSRGGKARAARLTPEERSSIARKGGNARWHPEATGDAR